MQSQHTVAKFLLLLFSLAGTWTNAAACDDSLSAAFKRVGPAVVIIHTAGRAIAPQSGGRMMSVANLGSGVLIDADGKVITAAHVVQTADSVSVEFPGDVMVNARIIAADAAADVALLQLDWVPSGIVPAQLGDSDKAEVGDEVFVVGAPLGIGHTLTVGHLSARRKPNATFGGIAPTEFFQTDAAINQGNSGGPMFDLDGKVIGIVSHIVSKSGGSEGLGFVVTSNMAKRLLFDEASVWSGIEGYLLAGELAQAFNIPEGKAGLLVQTVARGSTAEQLGLRGGSVPARINEEYLLLGGDVILSVDGIGLGDPGAYENIRRHLVEVRKSAGFGLSVLRGGKTIELAGSVRQ